jgi:hypothetical protein
MGVEVQSRNCDERALDNVDWFWERTQRDAWLRENVVQMSRRRFAGKWRVEQVNRERAIERSVRSSNRRSSVEEAKMRTAGEWMPSVPGNHGLFDILAVDGNCQSSRERGTYAGSRAGQPARRLTGSGRLRRARDKGTRGWMRVFTRNEYPGRVSNRGRRFDFFEKSAIQRHSVPLRYARVWKVEQLSRRCYAREWISRDSSR